MQYPSDRWIRYTPDVADRLVTIERLTSAEALDKAYWSSVQYAPQGAPKQINLGNSLIERWAFNVTRQQPWEIKIGTASNDSDRGKWQLAYCLSAYTGAACATNNGNIVGQYTSLFNRYQTYYYDALNRLSNAAEGGGGGWSEYYAYDRYSNLYTTSRLNLGTWPGMKPTGTDWYTNNKNRAVPPGQSENTYYDVAGNLIKYGALNVVFDASSPAAGHMPTGRRRVSVMTVFSCLLRDDACCFVRRQLAQSRRSSHHFLFKSPDRD